MKQLARMVAALKVMALLAAAGIFFGGQFFGHQAAAMPANGLKIGAEVAGSGLAQKAGYGHWHRQGRYRCHKVWNRDGGFVLHCRPLHRAQRYICVKECDRYGRWSMRCRPLRRDWEPGYRDYDRRGWRRYHRH